MDASETKIYISLLIAAVTIGGILGYFLLSMVRLHRRYLRLNTSRNEAQLLLVEKERTRIATDLHDELGPILSAAKFKLNEVEPISSEEQVLLSDASQHIDKIIGRIREISNGLMPNTLLRKGPFFAIEEFIRSQAASSDLKIEFFSLILPPLSQQQSVNIYRILQEVIHNTTKHAKAQNLKIQTWQKEGMLVIVCTDDGIGFNKRSIMNEKKGLGLQYLFLRTEMLGGSMFLDTKPGSGTKMIFEIPLQDKTFTGNEDSTDH
jgi:signal transduction histidine kinase